MASTRFPLLRRPVTWIIVGVAVVLLVVGLVVFEPYKLFLNQTVNESAPVAPAGGAPNGGPAGGAPNGAPAPGQPVVLATGQLISHEHATSGSVQVLRLPDGSRVLRLENLDTSNGPVLKVWLTDAPVIPGSDGWHVFDDGRYVDLGDLKGNKGSSNYTIPAGVDLGQLSSVSIWCERFAVSFGAATLTKTSP